MHLSNVATSLLLAIGTTEAAAPKHNKAVLGGNKYAAVELDYEIEKFDDAKSPKALVVSLFAPEADIWHEKLQFKNNVTVPGLSPLFPQVYCTKDWDVCNVITGEGEVNAAASISALLASPQFNFTETYFLVAGIAGINPFYGSLGSAVFPHYAVSAGLQYEVAQSEAPANWTKPYWSYGTNTTNEFPHSFYGTEAFELNTKLRDRAAALAAKANLSGSAAANRTGSLYSARTAHGSPKVLKCDSATSDVYFTGNILANAVSNITSTFTNNTGRYCVTDQEDSAVLEAALRFTKFGLVDFSRWVILRTASDFDRAPEVLANRTVPFFESNNTGGYEIAIENLYKAGYPFIQDVVKNWNKTYVNGTKVANVSSPFNVTNVTYGINSTLYNITILNSTAVNVTSNSTKSKNSTNGTYAPNNYVGDVFGYLGGEPDFGPGPYTKFNYTD